MDMKNGKILVVSVLAGMMSLGMGTAVAVDMDSGIQHGSADYNKDGMVSKDEMMTHCQAGFMKMDKDNDQMIGKNEWNNDWFLDQ